MKTKIVPKYSNDWNQAVSLVNRKYKRAFGADVLPNHDYFMVATLPEEMGQGSTEVVACAGINFNSTNSFFSEQYLNEPIEHLVSRHQGKFIDRHEIVEVGALASIEQNVGIDLMKILPVFLSCIGKPYVICTATKSLRRLFEKVGLRFVPLQDSDYRRIGEDAKDQWGRYYEKLPNTGFIILDKIPNYFPSNIINLFNYDVEITLQKREMEKQVCEIH